MPSLFVICIFDALIPSVEAANHNALRYCMSTALTSQPALQQQHQTVSGEEDFIGLVEKGGGSYFGQKIISQIRQ